MLKQFFSKEEKQLLDVHKIPSGEWFLNDTKDKDSESTDSQTAAKFLQLWLHAETLSLNITAPLAFYYRQNYSLPTCVWSWLHYTVSEKKKLTT